MTFQLVLPTGEVRPIPPEGLSIGRGRECQIQFDDTKVSRRHAVIWGEAERVFVRDEGSTNGTLVNGAPIQGGVVTELHATDTVQIGAQSLRIEAVVAQPVAPAVTPIDFDAVDAAPQVTPRAKSSMPIMVGVGALVLVFAAIAAILLGGGDGENAGGGAGTPSAGTAVAATTAGPAATAGAAATDAPAPTAVPALTPAATPVIPAAATGAPDAIVAVDTLNLRAGPGTSYDKKGSLNKGSPLTAIGQFNNCEWLKVTSATGEGWVAGTANYVTLRRPCGDIPVGSFRPKSGLLRKPSGGAGELTVENTTGSDAVIVLASSGGATVASAYVRAGETFQIKAIPDGTADTLFYASGSEWDGKQFTQSAAYQKFDQTLDFVTTATNFMTYKVTLQAINGNTTAVPVPSAQFPAVQ